MNSKIRLLLVLGTAILLTACGSTPTKEETAAAETVDRSISSSAEGAASDRGAAEASGMAARNAAALRALEDPANPLSQRVIYFEFDSSSVQPESQELIALHAAFLADHPGISVRLEGHADERGSREYNLGLGERRANAVERLMLLNGAAATQLETVSYGEERPVAFGHDEESWWQNRRVEIVYPQPR